MNLYNIMSSYIIAGSADSIDTAYCEEIARRIKSKYKNIDFRVVIKHPSEWEQYLQQICRIYGFLKKSNPIIYTFDGKIIGNREAFVQTTVKYFGLDEEFLIVENLTSRINLKLADEEIKNKKIINNNIRSLEQKIDDCYDSLLKKKILKYGVKNKVEYLVNGIEYIHCQVDGMVETINFSKQKKVPVVFEEIVPEDINLMALSLQDQIKPEEAIVKQAFVTNNQKDKEKDKHPSSQQDKMSEASKTNKMHQSIVSYDKDSKGVKQSNQTKLRIDQQNDDVPDYIDYPQTDTVICELSDQFFVAFQTKTFINEQMIFYHNEDPNGNSLRLHNDGRPIKGHRVLIKEIHYQNQDLIQQGITKKEISESQQEQPSLEIEENLKGTEEKSKNINQKSKTQPNIPPAESQKHLLQDNSKNIQDDAVSEPHTDLNIISHLNYHTLFIQKPLSPLEIKNLLYFIKQTNTIGCLQFLPQNPNPRVKLYNRKYLLKNTGNQLNLPVERFIQKQLQQKEYTTLSVPSEKGTLQLFAQINESFNITIINDVGFDHYIYHFNEASENQEKIAKVIKYTVDHMLSIQEELKRDIGYNLIFTKKLLMLVPLVEPYEVYNNVKQYFDGLAYLGFVHTAKLIKSYEIARPKIGNENKGEQLRSLLGKVTGWKSND